MRRIIDNDLLTFVSRLIIGGIFIYASFYKIVEPGTFARSIWYYHMVPGSLINLMALILPWLELVTGLALVLGVYYRGSVLLTGVMTVIFIVALSTAIAKGIDIDCGCFKASKSASGSAWSSLIFDIGMIVLILQLWFSRSRKWMIRGSD